MLSSNLIHLIEDHFEQITADHLQRVQKDPELPHIKKLPASELRNWARHILRHLGDWLAASSEKEVASCYQGLGRLRFEESVPLHESVRNFQNLKQLIVDYVRSRAVHETTLQIYAEEEWEHLLCRFFDSMVYHVVRGYETARREVA